MGANNLRCWRALKPQIYKYQYKNNWIKLIISILKYKYSDIKICYKNDKFAFEGNKSKCPWNYSDFKKVVLTSKKFEKRWSKPQPFSWNTNTTINCAQLHRPAPYNSLGFVVSRESGKLCETSLFKFGEFFTIGLCLCLPCSLSWTKDENRWRKQYKRKVRNCKCGCYDAL